MSLPADDEFEFVGPDDFEEGIAEARESLAAMEDGRAPVAEADDEAARLRGEGEAADGQVRVVTRAGGVVESVQVDPRAMRAGPERLGEQLAEAMNQALDEVREHAQDAARGAGVQLDQVDEHLAYAEGVAMERFGQLSDGLDDALVRIERFAEEG